WLYGRNNWRISRRFQARKVHHRHHDTIRQIMEKSWEFNITIHQLFVDFKQAYDSLDRNVFFSIMEEFCIPMKLIRLTKATLMDTKCRILIQNSLSDPFDIDTGFKQGD